jgi:uroporphyrin-III C-methyltransferase
MSGTVYLVGAGPGAADLLTVRAARLLARADLVLHDALVEPDVLALAPQARKLNVGKRASRPSTDQAFINRLLVRAARSRKCVVRLKGGDPMLFGRAQEEIDACRRAGVAVEIVPGVSAAFAAAAEAGVSLTQRRIARSVTFVTPSVGRGESESAEWADAAAAADSVALYMGASHAARVRDTLLARGVAPSTPLVLAESAGRPEARRTAGVLGDLADLAAGVGDGPVLLLLGQAFAKADAEIAPEILEARA